MRKGLLRTGLAIAALAFPWFAFSWLASSWPAAAQTPDINIGISISTTGYGAALGIPERNAVEFVTREIGGVRLRITMLDDAAEPSKAAANARRLATEMKSDVLIGSSVTPAALELSTVASELGVPHFSLALNPPRPDRTKWLVIMPQPVALMAQGLIAQMKATGVKTVAYIGFSDSYGDLWIDQFRLQALSAGIAMIGEERYDRSDVSVTGQVLRLISRKPDAVLIAASGAGAALPQVALRERGYQGMIYQTHGAASTDFIRIAGKAAEGVIMASGPVMAPEGQDDGALTRAPGLALNAAYEKKHGPGSRNQFSGHMYDVFEILKRVVPVALKSARPGTPDFREAIRKALLSERDIAGSQGVYNLTETDRTGVDERARILLTVKDGKYAVVK